MGRKLLIGDFQKHYQYIEQIGVRLAINEALTKRLYKDHDVSEIIGRPKLITLADQIGGAFSAEELDVLVFALGFSADDIGGDTMLSRPFHLVSFCQRRGVIDRLLDECERERPLLVWR